MRRALPLVATNAVVLAIAVFAVAGGGTTTLTPGQAVPPSASLGQVATPSPAAVLPSAAVPAPAASPTSAAAAVTTQPRSRPAAVPTAAPQSAPRAVPQVRRAVTRTGWRPYATVGPVTLHFPGDVVEAVGLHQSSNDGALPQSPVKGPARIGRLGTRARDTHPQGAADIVVDPTRPVRSPVTGTVVRAGTYALYCDEVDHFIVIEPDARPGWEVKLVHFEGLSVGEGDRVQAGVTRIGSRARVLPFTSQVDKHTLAPHWPHVHVEVVDPSVPDRKGGGGC